MWLLGNIVFIIKSSDFLDIKWYFCGWFLEVESWKHTHYNQIFEYAANFEKSIQSVEFQDEILRKVITIEVCFRWSYRNQLMMN